MADTPDSWFRLRRQLLPTDAETLALLNDLFDRLGKRQATALLSIEGGHLSKIITTGGRCSTQTKAHVWLVWALILRPGMLSNCFNLATYGRFSRNFGPQHAGGKPLAPLPRRMVGKRLVGKYQPRVNPPGNLGGRGHKNPPV